jgi:hypothetical protein
LEEKQRSQHRALGKLNQDVVRVSHRASLGVVFCSCL